MSEPVVYPEGVLDFTDQQDAVWFQNDINPVATVVYGDREVSVFVMGEVRVRVEDFVHRNVDSILAAGIYNDEQLSAAEERGDIEFLNNNWFEIIENDDDYTSIVAHTLHGAINAAVDYLVG